MVMWVAWELWLMVLINFFEKVLETRPAFLSLKQMLCLVRNFTLILTTLFNRLFVYFIRWHSLFMPSVLFTMLIP
jgi:hypothetical protein